MEIRKLKVEETENLKYLFKHKDFEKYKNDLIKDIENSIRDVYIIIDKGMYIGEITVYYKGEKQQETIPNIRVYLSAYRILKEYRGKGLGKKLLEYVINDLEKQGYTEFTIGVEDDNEIAIHIYNKFGFTETIARLSDIYDGKEYEYNLLLRKNINKKIEKLVKEYKLGTSVINIDKVTGGLSHRMYKVVTDKGIYAIKELNQGVMKKKEAYSNFIFSEKVVDIVTTDGIPAIGTIKLDDNIIGQIDNEHFMVFNWLDGKILEAEDITEKHCEIIGEILAQIHNIDFSEIENIERKKINIEEFDWNNYLKLAKKENKNYIDILEQNYNLLYELNKKSNESLKYANQNLVISHTDLDRKNVMWKKDTPFIIDWEASGYINPTIELIQVAWYWSGGDIEKLDYNKFEIVVNTYKKYAKCKLDKNIDKLIYADIYSGLEWLNYNFKRSLCIGCTYSQDEIELAENEIIQSIGEIKYNISQIDKMLEILMRCKIDG